MKRYIPILVTVVIFVVIFSQIDLDAFLTYFSQIHLGYLGLAFLFLGIVVVLSALRWRWILHNQMDISVVQSIRIFIAAMSLNSIMPFKMGDMSKALFLKQEGITSLARGGNSVVLEKLLDISALFVVFLFGIVSLEYYDMMTVGLCVFGSVFLIATVLFLSADNHNNPIFSLGLKLLSRWPKLLRLVEDTQLFVKDFKKHKKQVAGVLFLSLFLWFLHLFQIFLFFKAMRLDISIQLIFGLVPIAIFLGLMPLTLGGMGTRDAALIFLFAPYAPAAQMAGVGLLVSTRYWIPSLVGVPFLLRYLRSDKSSEQNENGGRG